jgi:uncharacterized metal-binding protein
VEEHNLILLAAMPVLWLQDQVLLMVVVLWQLTVLQASWLVLVLVQPQVSASWLVLAVGLALSKWACWDWQVLDLLDDL